MEDGGWSGRFRWKNEDQRKNSTTTTNDTTTTTTNATTTNATTTPVASAPAPVAPAAATATTTAVWVYRANCALYAGLGLTLTLRLTLGKGLNFVYPLGRVPTNMTTSPIWTKFDVGLQYHIECTLQKWIDPKRASTPFVFEMTHLQFVSKNISLVSGTHVAWCCCCFTIKILWVFTLLLFVDRTVLHVSYLSCFFSIFPGVGEVFHKIAELYGKKGLHAHIGVQGTSE